MRTEGLTDRTKVILAFRNFAKAPYSVLILGLVSHGNFVMTKTTCVHYLPAFFNTHVTELLKGNPPARDPTFRCNATAPRSLAEKSFLQL
jgi:hypothetical protein